LNNPKNDITLTADVLRDDFEDLPDDERPDMLDDPVSRSERAQRIGQGGVR